MSRPVKERQPENRWTPDEDEVLISAVERCGPIIVWSQVSACLPGRNNKSCRKRWIHSLDPTLRKGRWTEDEDSVLISAVETYGTHWFQVAKLLPGRTDDQCAKRWRENLDPAISRKPWTKTEDEILMEAYERLGKRWKEIASRLEGRPSVHCRNRVQSLVRAKRRAAKVRMAGKTKGKAKQRPSYEAVMTTDTPISSNFIDSWTNLPTSRSESSLVNTPETFELDSVSSVASRDLSISPQTPSSHSSDTPVEVVTHEARHSTVESFLDSYATGQSSSPQLFYHDVSPPTSHSTASNLDWASVQCSHGAPAIDQPLESQWEKIASTGFDPGFTERLASWNQHPTDSYLITSNLALNSLGEHQHQLLRPHSYHHAVQHDHHHVEQQPDPLYYHTDQEVGLLHGYYGDHHASLQSPDYLAPLRCNVRQTVHTSFSPALSS